jgi:hypothetical protein
MADSMRDLLYSKQRLEEVAQMLGPVSGAGVIDENRVLGVVVEIGLQPSEVTMAADAEAVSSGTGPGMSFLMQEAVMIAGYANGDARLLWTAGGGVVGDLYQFKEIADAARNLCSLLQPLLDQLQPQAAVPPLPATDIVRVTALTSQSLYSTEVPGPEIIVSTHPLNPVYVAARKLYDEVQALNEDTGQQK